MMGCSSEPASKNAESLPFFGEFDIELTTAADGTVEADTTYYPIPKFSFVNQDSVWITQKDYEGNITLVDFFFVKPETDTPAKLKAYATGIGADLSRWNFLTGKPQDIYDLAQEGFLLTAFPSDTAAGGIFHTDKVTLLDRQLRMRGYYDGTSTKSMDELFMDAVTLSQEN